MGIGKALHYSIGTVATTALAFAVVFVLMLDHEGAYKRANSLLRIRETERILRVSIHAFGIVLPASFFLSFLFSRWIVILAIVFVPLTLIIEKQIVVPAHSASSQPRLRSPERCGVRGRLHGSQRVFRACPLS
jgi:hypothetical protein